MLKLQYTVPSRIAIDLYDMNGNLGRVDGGMGFSIQHPQLVFVAQKADTVNIENEEALGDELSKSVKKALESVKDKYSFGGIKLTVLEGIPSQSGFGSKTNTLLSAGHAYGKLYGYNFDFRELGAFLRRGGTSGAGINLIDKGGFVLDGGHSTKRKTAFAPSSAVKEICPAPLLVRYQMPDWDVLIALPYTEKIHGQKEVEFFNRICPIPESDVERLARITLSQILPSLCEFDLEQFCAGINAVQTCYWKRNEIVIYGDLVSNIMNYMLENGAQGVGMSSIGPAVYAFGNGLEKLMSELENDTKVHFRLVRLTKPDNVGLRAEELE